MRVWPLFLLSGCVLAPERLIIEVSAPPQLSAPSVKAQSVSKVDIEVLLPSPPPPPQPAHLASPRPVPVVVGPVTQPSPTPSLLGSATTSAGPGFTRLGPSVPVMPTPGVSSSGSASPSPVIQTASPTSLATSLPASAPPPAEPPLLEQTHVLVPATEYFMNQPSNALVREAEFQITYASSQWILLYGGPFVVKGVTRCCIGGDSVNMKVYFNDRVVFDVQNPALQDGYDLTPFAQPGTLKVRVLFTNDTTGGGTLAPLTLKVLNLQPPPVFYPDLLP